MTATGRLTGALSKSDEVGGAWCRDLLLKPTALQGTRIGRSLSNSHGCVYEGPVFNNPRNT